MKLIHASLTNLKAFTETLRMQMYLDLSKIPLKIFSKGSRPIIIIQ